MASQSLCRLLHEEEHRTCQNFIFELSVHLTSVVVECSSKFYRVVYGLYSVASAIAGVFANFPNKIAKITRKFGHVDKVNSRGVLCQH